MIHVWRAASCTGDVKTPKSTADHRSTHVTETVYRHVVIPAIRGSATVMDQVFGKTDDGEGQPGTGGREPVVTWFVTGPGRQGKASVMKAVSRPPWHRPDPFLVPVRSPAGPRVRGASVRRPPDIGTAGSAGGLPVHGHGP